jgi:DNA-binding phage protein
MRNVPAVAAVLAAAVAVFACRSPSYDEAVKPASSSTASTVSTVSGFINSTLVDAAASEELSDWKSCLTDRIDRLYAHTRQRVLEIDAEIEGLVEVAEDADAKRAELYAAAEATSDPGELLSIVSDSKLQLVISLQARKQIDQLVTERDDLIRRFEETAATFGAARDGTRPANVDWSLCTGSGITGP